MNLRNVEHIFETRLRRQDCATERVQESECRLPDQTAVEGGGVGGGGGGDGHMNVIRAQATIPLP